MSVSVSVSDSEMLGLMLVSVPVHHQRNRSL